MKLLYAEKEEEERSTVESLPKTIRAFDGLFKTRAHDARGCRIVECGTNTNKIDKTTVHQKRKNRDIPTCH